MGRSLDNIEVLALVGPAGTGKSHRALLLAYDRKADLIIDDGLLIKGSRILAGRSAKSENLKITATKRALFLDPEHAREVREQLEKENPNRVLILGISENMARRIAENLGLPQPQEINRVEQVATESEILAARRSRLVEKKHAVPVVSVDIDRNSIGHLLDSFTVFWRRSEELRVLGENSIVRPHYSVLGKITIADRVVRDIAKWASQEVKEVKKVEAVVYMKKGTAAFIEVAVFLPYGLNLRPVLIEVQRKVYERLTEFTGLEIARIDILLKGLIFSDISDKGGILRA